MAIQTYIIARKQSLLDACIQVYGTSKLLFKFAKDNGLQIDSVVLPDENLVYNDELGDKDIINKLESLNRIVNNPGQSTDDFPVKNLIGQYSQEAQGKDLIDRYRGVSIPYVSGVGNDQIFDFSVLNSDKYNKNAYLGNAFALPEYYDFPYQAEIYFDTLNPFNWKLTDFHYRYISAQLLGFIDEFFAKIIYEATVLQQVDELLLYSIDQVGTDLDTLKTYIGILPDFEGSELITGGDFNTPLDWIISATWTIAGGKANYLSLAVGQIWQNLPVIDKTPYVFRLNVENSSNPGEVALLNNSGGVIFNKVFVDINDGLNEIELGAIQPSANVAIWGKTTKGTYSIIDVSLKKVFVNYYENEV